MGLFDFLNRKKLSEMDVQTIKRHVEILSDSVELVNNSCDLETVVSRFDTACNSLHVLSRYTAEDIKSAGCFLSKSPADTLAFMNENQTALINQAIQRNFDKKLNSLKTTKGKLNALDTLYQSFKKLWINNECISFLEQLYKEYKTELIKEPESQQKTNSSGDRMRIQELEQEFLSLKSFIQSYMEMDGGLPPCVPCRDSLPELYMRYGEWDKARQVICMCISYGAYGYTEYRNKNDHNGHWVAESGENELLNLRMCHEAADAVLAYLSKNPGTLQNKIYKIPDFATVNHDALVWFCRNSHQIRKEKDGKTNRLFVSNEVL